LIGLSSWGEKAHRKINSCSVDYFPKEIENLKAWEPVLANHGSDPDHRRREEKTEAVRHYIDIDNYDDFRKKHQIETNFAKACLKYGRTEVIKNGTLPWTTDSVYKALVNNFKSKNWKKAAMTAAFLGHYLGDGHMPLHVTANYDGESTGQKGIHRRYEETMIDRYIDQIQFRKGNCKPVRDVKSFVFAYLYKNNSSVSLLLKADTDALKTAAGQYNDLYYSGLWDRTRQVTLLLLEESSKTLARLIYSAWIEAGEPMIPKLQAGNNF